MSTASRAGRRAPAPLFDETRELRVGRRAAKREQAPDQRRRGEQRARRRPGRPARSAVGRRATPATNRERDGDDRRQRQRRARGRLERGQRPQPRADALQESPNRFVLTIHVQIARVVQAFSQPLQSGRPEACTTSAKPSAPRPRLQRPATPSSPPADTARRAGVDSRPDSAARVSAIAGILQTARWPIRTRRRNPRGLGLARIDVDRHPARARRAGHPGIVTMPGAGDTPGGHLADEVLGWPGHARSTDTAPSRAGTARTSRAAENRSSGCSGRTPPRSAGPRRCRSR